MKHLNVVEITRAWKEKTRLCWHPEYIVNSIFNSKNASIIVKQISYNGDMYIVEVLCSLNGTKVRHLDVNGLGYQSGKPMFVYESDLAFCPRCENGGLSYWPSKRVCDRCGFPGFKPVEEDIPF